MPSAVRPPTSGAGGGGVAPAVVVRWSVAHPSSRGVRPEGAGRGKALRLTDEGRRVLRRRCSSVSSMTRTRAWTSASAPAGVSGISQSLRVPTDAPLLGEEPHLRDGGAQPVAVQQGDGGQVGLDVLVARALPAEVGAGAVVRGPPPAVAAGAALGVLLDEAVLGELAQVVRRRAGVEVEALGQGRGGRRALGAQQAEHPQPDRVAQRAQAGDVGGDGGGHGSRLGLPRVICKHFFAIAPGQVTRCRSDGTRRRRHVSRDQHRVTCGVGPEGGVTRWLRRQRSGRSRWVSDATYTAKGKPFERDMDYISDRILAGERVGRPGRPRPAGRAGVAGRARSLPPRRRQGVPVGQPRDHRAQPARPRGRDLVGSARPDPRRSAAGPSTSTPTAATRCSA